MVKKINNVNNMSPQKTYLCNNIHIQKLIFYSYENQKIVLVDTMCDWFRSFVLLRLKQRPR